MTEVAVALQSREPLLDHLDREFDPDRLEHLGGGALRGVPWPILSRALYEPLVEFLRRPGKEFRGDLVSIAWQLGGRSDLPPPELPLVVEALHAGSLIVDDIEDGSSERRGAPALHCVTGMPTALNAGNWLYFWPLELLSRIELPDSARIEALQMIGTTMRECHYGQALDLSVKVAELAQEEVVPVVRAVSELKTGSLVALSTGLGALASGADASVVRAAIHFGRALGIALQMLDDLSGLLNEERAHKGREDLAEGRPTWAFAWASEVLSDAPYRALVTDACEVLSGAPADPLARELARLVGREGRGRVHAFLEAAFARLASEVPARHALGAVKRQMERLEKAYVR